MSHFQKHRGQESGAISKNTKDKNHWAISTFTADKNNGLFQPSLRIRIMGHCNVIESYFFHDKGLCFSILKCQVIL